MAAKIDDNTNVSPNSPSSDEKKGLDDMKNLFAHQAEMNHREQTVKVLGQILANLEKDAPQ